MTTRKDTTFFVTLAAAFVAVGSMAGCSSAGGDLTLGGDDGTSAGAGNDGGGAGSTGPACTNHGLTYQGFAGTELTTGRIDGARGADRGRVKPYSALQGEYPRVLATTPASLAGAAATFGDSDPRWYDEPQASAVSLFTAYSVAFDGCLTLTQTDAKYAAPPDAKSAPAACSSFARMFWSRAAAPAEVAACVDVGTVQAKSEPDARRRWAYACAAVLSSAGFLTY